MRHDVYFLLSAKQELINRIEMFNDSGLMDLVEPTLWSAVEPDRSASWPSDRDALVKVLFVDAVMRERSGEAAYAQVFSGLSAAISCFDKHWTLTRLRCFTSVPEAMEDSLEGGGIDSMIPTGSDVVDGILARSKKQWLEENQGPEPGR